MRRIVLIDDEQRMLDLLSLYLVPYGYDCIKMNSGTDGISYIEQNDVDLIILDVMMPLLNGWETLKKLREFSNTPIIMLTARNDTSDMVKGLKIGADDYISKPFNEEVLIARIEAVLRRTVKEENWNKPLYFRGLTLDPIIYKLDFNGVPISVTPKEFDLLKLFLLNSDKVFTRDHLLATLWEFKAETENRTIDSHIRNLRDKLRKTGFEVDKHLKTIWGIGYRWNKRYE
ncbi:response regulator transcription factor [Alkalihalobacillus pseudalcaliphilus]|uniref:response regulator transcription factor n=1 Tax=Alkalihalobacillus pseudalcaliphilus TaxID=79884 RepID=UPI00064DDB01|nr:response regulator transcription factor [Alkalihalobacillus pseudalcaliphilus]KMK76326.1 XRE family transcriptional regulator [Alkalihalobacillus pseudalcaliphilus]